jgi:AraC-like DNA-binding protein
MNTNLPIRVSSITQALRIRGLEPPLHPLVCILELGSHTRAPGISAVLDFYMITIKKNCNNLMYGQQIYDFDEGKMAFIAPNQVLTGQDVVEEKPTGWMLLVHPDFFYNTTLAKKIKEYDFFDYSVNEALFLSPSEEETINDIIAKIKHEYSGNIDKFTQDIIISHIETLLNYSQRFYERQFITRKIINHSILGKLEDLLSDYFNNAELLSKGLPSVQYFADKLNMSAKYLSSMLKQLTGMSTQEHIHKKLIEKAKEKLSTTDLSVSEIAYELGFEHSQSFSKLFKSKVEISPLEFRAGFN